MSHRVRMSVDGAMNSIVESYSAPSDPIGLTAVPGSSGGGNVKLERSSVAKSVEAGLPRDTEIPLTSTIMLAKCEE
jgi:hypothetical protein